MYKDSLYSIIREDTQEVEIQLADASHPIFEAHFPGKPILPGYCHFEIISELFALEIDSIKKTKFLKMVAPLEKLCYKQEGSKYTVTHNGEKVAQISL